MMQKQHVQFIREALLRQQEMHKKQKQHKTVVVGQKPKDSIINNSNYDLQFVYKCFDNEERESLIACTPTQAMKLDGPFDFDDFKQATQSASFPPMFQQLVQDAIHHELHPPKIPAYSLEAFSGTLRPNQVAALEFSLSRPHALLALETGLGKTATSYAYMATLWPNLKNDRILVVCPAHLRPNWLEEGKRFLNAYQKQIAVIQEAKTAPKIVDCSDIKVIIVSYTMLESVKTLLLKNQQHYQLIVCDEAHYMQSSKSRCSVALFALRKHTDHMLLLSATPSATCTSMWNLLRMLNPVVFADFFHYKNPNIPWPHSTSTFYFAERYVQPEKVYTKGGALQWAFKRSVRRQELHALTRKYILYQCKRDILTELPPLCFEQLVVGSATLEQKIAFQATMERIVDIEQKKGHVFAEALFMQQVRETARQKLPFVLQYIHDLLKQSDTKKFIVWAYHKVVMQTISDDLTSKGITHILVNGDTPKKQRASLFEKLQKDPETKIAVMSLEACGTGLNFAFIQLSLYAELTFRYKAHVQSEGRCYRIGQTGETIARYLVLENSTDDIVWKSMQRKRDNESMILNNEHSQLTFEKIIAFQEQLPDLWNDAQQQQEQEEEENEENEEQHNISPKRQKTSCVQ